MLNNRIKVSTGNFIALRDKKIEDVMVNRVRAVQKYDKNSINTIISETLRLEKKARRTRRQSM